MNSSITTLDDHAFDLAPPEAGCLIESLRAFGYELQTALADLVDNSVTAGAKNVWIDFYWNGEKSVITVTDDGKGMDEKSLLAAMRPGSQNPLKERDPNDLGRYGLGLKTASFSQARRLTVRSITNETQASTRCWDLDHVSRVKDWQLLRSGNLESEPYFHRFAGLKCGTSVVWQNLDKLVAGQSSQDDRAQQLFLKRADFVRKHLAMVFHQLMQGRDAVSLFINDRKLEPWDPFLADEPATQILAESKLKIHEALVSVQPYILPHHSKISKAKYEEAAGLDGWNAHQGFFVYRNRRLLVAGDWMGLGWTKDEYYKLARIRVEIPNQLDQDWSIDVTKSRARPPSVLRDDLRRIAERCRTEAKRVYSHRGAKLTPSTDQERVLIWESIAKHDRAFYRLNREHPLLKKAVEDSAEKSSLKALLRLIEETIPFLHVSIFNSENTNQIATPFEHSREDEVQEIMREAFESLVNSGYGRKEAAERLRTIWPFEMFPAALQSLVEQSHTP